MSQDFQDGGQQQIVRPSRALGSPGKGAVAQSWAMKLCWACPGECRMPAAQGKEKEPAGITRLSRSTEWIRLALQWPPKPCSREFQSSSFSQNYKKKTKP